MSYLSPNSFSIISYIPTETMSELAFLCLIHCWYNLDMNLSLATRMIDLGMLQIEHLEDWLWFWKVHCVQLHDWLSFNTCHSFYTICDEYDMLYKHTGLGVWHIEQWLNRGSLMNVQIEQLHCFGLGFNEWKNNRLNVTISIWTPNFVKMPLICNC